MYMYTYIYIYIYMYISAGKEQGRLVGKFVYMYVDTYKYMCKRSQLIVTCMCRRCKLKSVDTKVSLHTHICLFRYTRTLICVNIYLSKRTGIKPISESKSWLTRTHMFIYTHIHLYV